MALLSRLVVVGTDAFTNKDFSGTLDRLTDKFEIIYVPDINTCLSRIKKVDAEPKPQGPSSFKGEWFILSDVEDLSPFSELAKLRSEARIMGVPAFIKYMLKPQIYTKLRPVFNFSMLGAVICITGFHDCEVVNRLATLINWMGGSVRRSLSLNTTTHLVAYRCSGEKVRDAALVSNQIATVKSSWVEEAWSSRKNPTFAGALDSEFVATHRAKVFQETRFAFLGFSVGNPELVELCRLVSEHDGSVTDNLHDERLTHVIVADSCSMHINILEKLRELELSGSRRHSYQSFGSPTLQDISILDQSSLSPAISETKSATNFSLNKSMTEDLKQIDPIMPYVVPVLRLEWFWISLQFSYLCPVEPYLYSCQSTPTNSNSNKHECSQLSLPPIACSVNKMYHVDPVEKSTILLRHKRSLSEANIHRNSLLSALIMKTNHSEKKFEKLKTDELINSNSLVESNTNDKENPTPFLCSLSLSKSSNLPNLISSSKPRKSTYLESSSNRSPSNEKFSEKLTQTPTNGKRKSSSRLSLFHSTARKSRTPASDLTSNISDANPPLSSDGSPSLQTTPLCLRLEKRQHRVFEFFVTERNYVEILRYLYNEAYLQVVDEDQSGGSILPRKEADYIFGKLGAIYDLHERLQPKLTNLENNWSLSDSCLKDVLQMSLLDEMDKAYGNYMQFYSPPHLHHLGEQYPRFLAFMRQVEKRKESGRQSLAALLVRPVQRLPSISLLMEGIAKFTPSSHPDYNPVQQFAKGLNNILTKINDRLKKNEERLSLLSLYHEINGAPPEMLSSSRSLVGKLNVFELGTNASGNTTCEPVTLFLLSDSLEVARPRRRHTGEPLAHAIRAALAAVQCDGQEYTMDGVRDQSVTNNCDPTSSLPSASTSSGNIGSNNCNKNGGVVTRNGSGASGNSLVNLSLMEGKQRCCYKHLQLLKLHEIKRVVNFDTASPDRAAFGLVVRSSSEVDDRVYAYCLAASFAASAAVVSGKCPEPVESAVAAASASGFIFNTGLVDNSVLGSSTQNSANSHVAVLQACVGEAKRVFLHLLCHHICQVSCIVNSPDELLVDVEPEELLGFDLEQVFNATALALSSKRLTRQLTRNISVKTPRRLAASAKRQLGVSYGPLNTPNSHHLQVPISGLEENHMMDIYPMPSPRRSMLGSFLGSSCTSLTNFLNTALRPNNPTGSLNRALQPPNRLALTPKPARRLPSHPRQNSFDDLDLIGDEEHFSHIGTSMMSLTSLDSLSTLDNPLQRLEMIPNRNTPNPKCGKGTALWETESHLGISASDEIRCSFRSPSSSHFEGFDGICSKKHNKKQKKTKLRAVSQLFQRSSIIAKAKESRKASTDRLNKEFLSSNLNTVSTTSASSSGTIIQGSCVQPSRRDSLLRGLFFRQN